MIIEHITQIRDSYFWTLTISQIKKNVSHNIKHILFKMTMVSPMYSKAYYAQQNVCNGICL